MHRQLDTVVALVILGCMLNSATAAYTHYRLPTSIQPDRYKLKIITNLEDPPENSFFDGQVSIRFKVLQDTSNITLHVKNLTIDDTRIILRSYGDKKFRLCGKGIDTVPEQDYYIIRLCEPLIKGEMYKLKLYFSGILTETLEGYYRSSYMEKETNQTKWLAVTQFEPAGARAAFPCLDEPNYKAKFIIWLGHHKAMTALSNMPLEKQIPLNGTDNFVWSIFEESVPMSTYLVAYTVNDFSHISSKPEQGSKVAFRIWARKEAIDQCDYVADVGPKILKYYEDIFGIAFPLPKVDDIAVPDFSGGAMENWGLITYKEPEMLFAPNVSSESNKHRIATVIAHELAHQWFGNLVTMEWWSDLWLNEGFATYIASLGVHNLNPEWDSYNKDSLENLLTIFREDAKESSRPISQPILDTSEILQRFDAVSYMKGSTVLRMLHMLLGHDAFFEGVRDYLKKHEYKNTEQNNLWAAFTETARKYDRIDHQYDMKTIMDSWTLQTGYPLVKVNRDYKTGSIDLNQQRYLEPSGSITEEEENPCWWVPLSYTTASAMDFNTTTPKAWLECDKSGKSVTLKLDNVAKAHEWIMFNMQLSGFYRIMYDKENLRLLKETLNSDKFTSIHVMNRAQLIDDALALALDGYQDYNVTFDILDYMVQEREYLPWFTALEGLSTVNNLLKPFGEHHSHFKAYMRYIIEPVYNYLDGLKDDVVDNIHSRVLHKSLIAYWACNFELEDCVKSAVHYFQQWKESANPTTENLIPVDMRKTVYCTAIRHGDEDDWQFLWQRYTESNVDTEKTLILASLSCSSNVKILRDYIDMVFVKKYIHKQYATYVLSCIGANDAGESLVRDYIEDHKNDILEFFDHVEDDCYELFNIMDRPFISSMDLNKLTNGLYTHEDYFYQKGIQSKRNTKTSNIIRIENNVRDINPHL